MKDRIEFFDKAIPSSPEEGFPKNIDWNLKEDSLWYRIKRRIFAKPYFHIDADGHYIVAWHWSSGLLEIVDYGNELEGGKIVEVPLGTKVVFQE